MSIRLKTFLLLLLTVVIFTACSPKEENKSAPKSAPKEEQKSAQQTPTSEEAPAPQPLLPEGETVGASAPVQEPVINTETVSLPVEEETPPPQVPDEISAFLNKYVNTNVRPVAVMIDNDNDQARPHAGLDDAYLIYEMVIEGGSTRFMALFRSDATQKIGPIRSSRHYFLDYVMENDAIYTHYGWSPKAQSDISAFKINKINGVLGTDEKIFWRDRTYTSSWHSAYTSMENILGMAKKKGYSTTTSHKGGITYSDNYINLNTQTTASNITLRYSTFYNTGYVYNDKEAVYQKTINGKPHLMQNGNTLKVKNIIIEFIKDTSLGDGSGRREIKTTGSGSGYYITNGKCEKITWSKSSRKENTTYTKADGTPLQINPGKTIVNIINPSAKVTIK